jgi:hypothetical protein
MIRFEHIDVMNLENAIRGMRNPLNSWEKSDSKRTLVKDRYEFVIGPNDLALARKLASAGSDHRKFLRQIIVSIDITAPLFWWKEFDTYKVGTVANSCSTMHKIHSKEFTKEDFSVESLDGDALTAMDNLIAALNYLRNKYNTTKDKKYWRQMIEMLPSSYNQKRTCTMSYENLINIYFARRYHKLHEWHTLCDLIESLPHFEDICLGGDNNE